MKINLLDDNFNSSLEDNNNVMDLLELEEEIPLPLNLDWDEDILKSFLKKRGYIILEREDEAGKYNVAIKGDDIISDYDNLIEVFSREFRNKDIQKKLIKLIFGINI